MTKKFRVYISEHCSFSKIIEAKNEEEARDKGFEDFTELNISRRVDENLLEDIKKDLLETCEINKNINWDNQETAPSEECLLFIDNLNRYIPKYQNPNTEWQEIKKSIVSKLEDFSSSENPNVFFNDLGITIENLFSNCCWDFEDGEGTTVFDVEEYKENEKHWLDDEEVK